MSVYCVLLFLSVSQLSLMFIFIYDKFINFRLYIMLLSTTIN